MKMNEMAKEFYKHLNLLDPMERELYRVLDTFTASREETKCRPSIAAIAEIFKRSRNTTKKYLRLLLAKGFINIQARKAIGKVTNNKYNQTNEYTLLLKRYGKAIIPKANGKKPKVLVCKESDMDIVIRELTQVHNESVVVSALKTMRTNMRNGSIIRNMKSYLETLINKASGQMAEVDKAIESVKANATDNKSINNKTDYSSYKPSQNKINTKFHNFEQRTSKYSPEELERKVLANTKRK